ncbi:MAG: hypothetical protein A2Y12_05005 [Planctomycetes bacterium GWF2_42_9]|nr:MAG: hypothetical protein A2Y12_05005 [Planctomycetes bacterium GWF2_42_9]
MHAQDWLTTAVFYQVYPQSFYDSNEDGIGDIPGIIEKLDYIASLGCNAIWLNPCFVSPFKDAGYDVADYRKVAPRYGQNTDLKRLFRQARKKGIRVFLDFVAGHTSIEHPWFKQSCDSDRNKYTNRYIWTSHWLENTEEYNLKVVRGFGNREGSFVTNFFWAQPALNYGFAEPDPQKKWQLPTNHPDIKALQNDMIEILQFWLSMGAAGFRVDMASSLVKGDSDKEKTIQLWKAVRKELNKTFPDAVLISEWCCPADAIKAGFDVDFILEWECPIDCIPFRQETGTNCIPTEGHSFFRKKGKGDISKFMRLFLDHYQKTAPHGYMAIYTGNHDVQRISLGRTQKEIELIFAFILTMPVIPFIYYGDEIGMRYLNLPSKEGGYLRTGSRTPMQWSVLRNAGFSKAKQNDLYLPIDPSGDHPTVEQQQLRRNSLLSRVRRLIQLRRESEALSLNSGFELLYCRPHKYPLIYRRHNGREQYLIAINPSVNPVSVEIDIPKNMNTKLLMLEVANNASIKIAGPRLIFNMPGTSFCIARAE